MTEYFRLWYRLNQADGWLIWFSTDEGKDGVLLDSSGRIPAFSTSAGLLAHGNALGLTLQDEPPTLHNLDIVQEWLSSSDPEVVDCHEFLSAWNLFRDVSFSLADRDFTPRNNFLDRIYDKLFWGCNLPSVTPPGRWYEPIWNDDELVAITKVIRDGIKLFLESIVMYD